MLNMYLDAASRACKTARSRWTKPVASVTPAIISDWGSVWAWSGRPLIMWALSTWRSPWHRHTKIFFHQVTKILFLWPFHGFRLPKNAAQQPQLKTDCLFYSIYKLDTIDIADPSSMLEACHMNFLIDLPHHRVSVAQW